MSRKNRVAVLGGGLSGMAAALRLAESGFQVSLHERRTVLGGRASSFQDPKTGEWIDGCQHVSLKSCTNLADFYQRIGATDTIGFSRSIPFVGPGNRKASIEASPLPPPFHLSFSLFRLPFLSMREKIQISRAMIRILRKPEVGEEDFRAWLKRNGQSDRVIRCFWEPILVSALNEQLHKVCAKAAFQVVFEGMLKNRSGYEVGLPRERLGTIYSGYGLRALREKGVEVRFGEIVSGIDVSPLGLRLKGEQVFSADWLVAAVPYQLLLDLLPAEIVDQHLYFGKWRGLGSSPILGVHLWFDRPISKTRYGALVDKQLQWFFHKEGGYVNLVVSASRFMSSYSHKQILDLTLRELKEIFPEARHARLIKSRIVHEKNATFSAAPGTEKLRPSVKTPIDGLYVAGDWTKTGWPATMEGAVRSGYLAAEGIAREAGMEQSFLRADLPAEGFVPFFC